MSSPPSKPSLVVLISGGGSNLQAIIDAINNGILQAEIKAVISNTADAKGLQRATKENITTHVIDHRQFETRESFDKQMMKVIDPLKPELVVLAGFMRILSTPFIKHYHHHLINIHPSLLPKYKGLNTHQQALDNHDKKHGASVHYVSDELDSGPVVIQAEVPVINTDTVSDLAARVLQVEHIIYPLAIQFHCQKRVSFKKDSFNHERLHFDNKCLNGPLLWKDNKLVMQ